jgi:hypothetical protein
MIEGICNICRRKKPLSFEHVPPESAFNNRPVVSVSIKQMIELGPGIKPKGPVKQKGVGIHSLCEECNNNTGSWYSAHFIDWCYRGMEILKLSQGNPNLVYEYRIYPLSIIKQIIVMFLASNGLAFSEKHPALSEFILDRYQKQLPKMFRIYTYYNIEGIYRNTGITGRLDLRTGKNVIMSEISFPPFGYLLTIESEKPDKRLLDITNFANYEYKEISNIQIIMPTLPTILLYPGDYRTKEEILKQKEKNS